VNLLGEFWTLEARRLGVEGKYVFISIGAVDSNLGDEARCIMILLVWYGNFTADVMIWVL